MLTARLTQLDGKKLEKMRLANEADARAAEAKIVAASFQWQVESKQAKRNPSPPFITSTLQQEASRKLRLPAARTMQVAQRLYEGVDIGGETVGLITYMRTDGVTMAAEAIGASPRRDRRAIWRALSCRERPASIRPRPRTPRKRMKPSAPPTSRACPEDVARYLDGDQLQLYELIWKRAIASQMESAEQDQVAVDIVSRMPSDHPARHRHGHDVRRLPHPLSGRPG